MPHCLQYPTVVAIKDPQWIFGAPPPSSTLDLLVVGREIFAVRNTRKKEDAATRGLGERTGDNEVGDGGRWKVEDINYTLTLTKYLLH